MVEQHCSLGYPQGVVIADADHAGAELDVASALSRGGDEDLGRGDDLAAGRMVLADPGLIPAEPVEMLDQSEVALQRQCRVLAGGVERGHEDSEAKPVGHDAPSLGPALGQKSMIGTSSQFVP